MNLYLLVCVIYCWLIFINVCVNSATISKSHHISAHQNNRNNQHIIHQKYHNEIKNIEKYNEDRNNIINIENDLRLGGRLRHNFTKLERDVHEKLLRYRQHELDIGIKNSSANLAGMHFFQAKDAIEKSPVFKIIQQMPKGAALHGHNTAMVSSDWILNNLTYRESLRMCRTYTGIILLTFRLNDSRCITSLDLVVDHRRNASSIDEFDAKMRTNFDLFSPKNIQISSDIDTVWDRFSKIFGSIGDILRYLPIFKDYHERLLEELYEDNVMYAEIRASLNGVYDEHNRNLTPVETTKILENLVIQFKNTHPNFVGVKFIYAVARKQTKEEMKEKLEIFNSLYLELPHFVIGFDLVGQEDKGEPIINYYDEIQQLPDGAKLFFHAGETNWYGTSTDFNILDAILQKTKRIGHGYSLDKHPLLMQKVKEMDIGIEILPISNQVLGLVMDLRNHPACVYVSENLPIVISSDDPSFWGAKGLSYDFYYALMSFAPYDAGLEVLKQLVLNSIRQSELTNEERNNFDMIFDESWIKFLNNVIKNDFYDE